MPKRHEFQSEQDWLDHLRIYFAAKAMAEMSWIDRKESAEACYSVADAMLAARKAGAK